MQTHHSTPGHLLTPSGPTRGTCPSRPRKTNHTVTQVLYKPSTPGTLRAQLRDYDSLRPQVNVSGEQTITRELGTTKVVTSSGTRPVVDGVGTLPTHFVPSSLVVGGRRSQERVQRSPHPRSLSLRLGRATRLTRSLTYE